MLLKGCSTGYYADYSQRKCVLDCNASLHLYKEDDTMQCVDQCPFGQYGVYKNLSAKYCSIDCPLGWFKDNSTWTCVQVCPSTPSYYADIDSGECIDACREELDLFAYDFNRTCLSQCPASEFADNYTRRCLLKCLLEPNTYEFVNGTERICVLQCPIDYFADNSTRKCVTGCPNSPNYFAHW